jgi:hypothetical protein
MTAPAPRCTAAASPLSALDAEQGMRSAASPTWRADVALTWHRRLTWRWRWLGPWRRWLLQRALQQCVNRAAAFVAAHKDAAADLMKYERLEDRDGGTDDDDSALDPTAEELVEQMKRNVALQVRHRQTDIADALVGCPAPACFPVSAAFLLSVCPSVG